MEEISEINLYKLNKPGKVFKDNLINYHEEVSSRFELIIQFKSRLLANKT